MEILAGLLIALAVGGTAFFALLFSPLVFAKLPQETAAPFIRQVFPFYSLAVALLFALAAPLLFGRFPSLAVLATLMALLGALNRQAAMPRIGAGRDGATAGNGAGGGGSGRPHRASAAISVVQILAAAWMLAALLAA